jgi:hypothetical protein
LVDRPRLSTRWPRSFLVRSGARSGTGPRRT